MRFAFFFLIFAFLWQSSIAAQVLPDSEDSLGLAAYVPAGTDRIVSRSGYLDRLHGFWLGQCLANWTGLITEMDKIGGEGVNGRGAGFYTRKNWGGPDEPNLWGSNRYADTIGFYLVGEEGTWGADDDTDIEYIYQEAMVRHRTGKLSAVQIRDAWLQHIYSDENTPFRGPDGQPENFLWVSNQTAHDLMRTRGLLPPDTGSPRFNPNYGMIDAQLTTEIFGLFAPGRPDVALDIAYLPIRTTAAEQAVQIAEFYVILHSLAGAYANQVPMQTFLNAIIRQARRHLADDGYPARMFDFVHQAFEAGMPWEETRDALHVKYQVRGEDGYTWPDRDAVCRGCFAAGINFGASIISLLYGAGDFRETVKIGALCGWDSDNPTATWGGLLGFFLGRSGLEKEFGQRFSDRFHIHRTRGGFPEGGIDRFGEMAEKGIFVTDQVIRQHMLGGMDASGTVWYIPNPK